jgi:hypothetical protein
MKTLVYCYNEEDLELLGNATEAVRRYNIVPSVGDFIISKDEAFTWEYWQVARCIFNYKGSGTIDLMLREIDYKDLYGK